MIKEQICGIYCIENLIIHKRYIGQSTNIHKRWNNHISCLNNNTHYNSHLQRAWIKYGKEAFDFLILEKCEANLLNQKEQYWISFYDSYKNGYNLTAGGEGTFGVQCSDEKKIKISKANTGRKLTKEQRKRVSDGLRNSPNVLRGENHPFYNRKLSANEILQLRNGLQIFFNNNIPSWSKSVICVTTGKMFETITKAANEYGIKSKTNISACCDHKREFAGELLNGTRLQWEWYEKGKKYTKKEQLHRLNKEKPIIQYDLNYEYIREWKSAKECSDNTGLSRSKISNVCKGIRNKTGGFIFEYKNDLNGDIIDDKTKLVTL